MTGRLPLFESAVDAAGYARNERAVCRRPEHRPERGRLTLWEGHADREQVSDRWVRHRRAVALCETCPVLDACRAWLEDITAAGLSVDGVVAGEVRRWTRTGGEIVAG